MGAAELPIVDLFPALFEALDSGRHFVVQAEPGAGKTTGIPPALLERSFAGHGEIWVTQPRRLAARMAGRRVASLLGEPVGGRCGYQVRFETKASPETRIRFVTEGILARRLRSDPELAGIGMVILDEFHERHLDADLTLALLHRLADRRADLRIGVMSATLDPDPLAEYLSCPPLRCPGRTHPVTVTFADKASDRPLGVQVAHALRRLGEQGLDGSVLVFLPGAREIRQTHEACEATARHLGLLPVTLHGDLSAADQDRAVQADQTNKLILSTNVAETSITIEGVVAVIDSGLARQASHNPWTGVPTLRLEKISQASAEQRAGRAGRTRPGACHRLYTRADYDRRAPYDPPELHRLDLTAAMLDLRAAGVTDPFALPWFQPPPQPAVDAAHTLLQRLGALHTDGRMTELGRAMLEVPLHPRLARLYVEATRRGIGPLGATVAALLSERPIRRRKLGQRGSGSHRVAMADVLLDAEDLQAWERRDRGNPHTRELDSNACKTVLAVRDQILSADRGSKRRAASQGRGPTRHAEDIEEALGYALLTAFPDRIGAVREHGREVVFAEGGSAQIGEEAATAGAAFMVVLDVEERRAGTRGPTTWVRGAAAVELDWLLDTQLDRIEEQVELTFDPSAERVEAHEELRLGAIVLQRTRRTELPQQASEVLFEAARSRGLETFVDPPQALTELQARTAFAHRYDPDVPVLDRAQAEHALRTLCEGRRSFAELRKADIVAAMLGSLPPKAHAALQRLAPSRVTLAGGRRLAVHYELDRPPWVQSRLQDFFGSDRGPAIAEGREPVVLHLLAPNRRAVQVTTDLAGFWERHYPELRRALLRRYPKHDWPDDPRTAKPPAPGRTRRRR